MIITDIEFLKQPCNNVSLFEAQDIINKLESELLSSSAKGIGLAANQIGINANVCIIRTESTKINLVNPIVIEKYDLRMFKHEGCLSFPNQWLTTKRYNEILVRDLFRPAGVIFVGLEAVVAQHEIGHLNGELMHDYIISIPLGPNSPCWCDTSGKKWKKCHQGLEIKG
jgi:peptide deformylase